MAILLTNDDGIDAPGIAALAEALEGLDSLVVSAPAGNRSGVGGSITLGRSMKTVRHPDGPAGNFPRHSIDGSPADAVKYGLQRITAGNPPRLVASGINNGLNIGFNIRNSGTLGAAFEAAESGIPALAVSMRRSDTPDWRAAKHFARLLAAKMLALPAGRPPFVLNLNTPSCAPEEVRGLVFARAGLGGYNDLLVPGEDGRFSLHAEWIRTDADSNCDGAAVDAGYAVATPLRVDMTDAALMARLCGDWDIRSL